MSLNKVALIGRLGQDPEARELPTGSKVVNLSVATSETWKDKSTGEKKEKTEWHRVVIFNRLAEICEQYLRKGSHIYIEGSLRTRKWQDNSGADKYTTEIVAREMQMLDGAPGKTTSNEYQPPSKTTDSQLSGNSGQFNDGFKTESFDDDIAF